MWTESDRRRALVDAHRARTQGDERRAIALYRRILREEPDNFEVALRVAPLLAGRALSDIVERVPLQGDSEEPLRKELENFRDAVVRRRPPLVSGADGRAALAVALSIQERIEQNVVDTRPT